MGGASLRASPLMPHRPYESPLWFRALSIGSAPVLIWILAQSALVETSPLGLLLDTYGYFLRMIWETPWVRTAALVEHTLLTSLGAVLVAAIDFLFGWTALRLLLRGGRLSMPVPLQAAAALAMGLGLSGTLLFGLGIAGQLHRTSVLALTALQAAAGFWVLSRKRERRRAFLWLPALRPARGNRLLVAAILAILSPPAVLHLFDLLHPVTAFDSANYHMAAAKIYRDTATLSFLDGVRFNAQPHLSVLLYLRHWLLWDEDFAAKLVNLEFELILLLTVVYGSRGHPLARWLDPRRLVSRRHAGPHRHRLGRICRAGRGGLRGGWLRRTVSPSSPRPGGRRRTGSGWSPGCCSGLPRRRSIPARSCSAASSSVISSGSLFHARSRPSVFVRLGY